MIGYLNDVKNSFNSYTMSAVSIAAGAASVADETYFQDTVAKVVATRERVRGELERLGFVCTDARTNFLFASHRTIPAREIFEALRAEKIYVRFGTNRGYPTICASPSERTRRWTGCLRSLRIIPAAEKTDRIIYAC